MLGFGRRLTPEAIFFLNYLTMADANKPTTYAELVRLVDNPEELANRDKLNALLMHPPRANWLKTHPTVKVKDKAKQMVAHKYLPIDKKKFLLITIFGGYRQEIKEVKQLANSIHAIVRVHYKDPVTGEWTWQDGSGAFALQTDAGAGATNLAAIKSGAVEMGAPNAVSRAFSNAVENIGRLFGMDLETWDAVEFQGIYRNTVDATTVPDPPDNEQEPATTSATDEITTSF